MADLQIFDGHGLFNLQDLTADFAALIVSRVDVDVPLARHQISRLCVDDPVRSTLP